MNNGALWLALGIGGFLLMSAKKASAPGVNEAKYAPYLHAAEMKYGIPNGVLKAMARVESNFRPDAIGPVTKYGQAKGILQLMEIFHPGVDPMDPVAAIDYAGKYLASLYKQFGDWQKAVAAYNWGPANVKSKWPNMPDETRNYIRKVFLS